MLNIIGFCDMKPWSLADIYTEVSEESAAFGSSQRLLDFLQYLKVQEQRTNKIRPVVTTVLFPMWPLVNEFYFATFRYNEITGFHKSIVKGQLMLCSSSLWHRIIWQLGSNFYWNCLHHVRRRWDLKRHAHNEQASQNKNTDVYVQF
jgi:hypothetical protein